MNIAEEVGLSNKGTVEKMLEAVKRSIRVDSFKGKGLKFIAELHKSLDKEIISLLKGKEQTRRVESKELKDYRERLRSLAYGTHIPKDEFEKMFIGVLKNYFESLLRVLAEVELKMLAQISESGESEKKK
mmetsp:Transcript_14217/g.21602  ORF Transcript_14217/g.21602 Transcript_14217/m.21602 type:complete len:130 (+) Transcript_14217:1649-2038(+)